VHLLQVFDRPFLLASPVSAANLTTLSARRSAIKCQRSMPLLTFATAVLTSFYGFSTISSEVFDTVSEYIITKPQLCGRVVLSV
jgi:hypothetical protein